MNNNQVNKKEATKQSVKTTIASPPQTPSDFEDTWVRIEGGLEKLESMAAVELNEQRRERMYNALAEARCV